MLYEDPNKNIDAPSEDIDQLVAKLVGMKFEKLINDARSNYRSWMVNGYFTEIYLAGKLLELLQAVSQDGGAYIDPYERYQVVLICASKHTSEEKEQRLARYANLNKDIDWKSITGRAKVLALAMHRSAVIATLVVGDRLWEESKIIAKKNNLISQGAIAQTTLYVKSVHESIRQLLRAIRHATYLKVAGLPTILLTEGGAISYFPKVELYDEVIDSAVECLQLTGIFIPVVQKTITEQRNPFMLYAFTRDLTLLFGEIEKTGKILTEKQVRECVAEFARTIELKERAVVWMTNLVESEYVKKQLSRPFAQKIIAALNADRLGHGSISKILQERVARSTPRVRSEAAQVLHQVIEVADATVAGVRINTVSNLIVWDDQNNLDLDATVIALKQSKLLSDDYAFTNKDKLQLNELAEIIKSVRSFS